MKHYTVLIFLCALNQISGLQVTKVDQSVVKVDNETFTLSVTLHYTASQNDPTVIEIDEFGQKYVGNMDPKGWSSSWEPGKITSLYKMVVKPYPEDYSTKGLEDYVVYHTTNIAPYKIIGFSFKLRRSGNENSPEIGTIREDVDFDGNEFTKTRNVQSPVWLESPRLITNCRWLEWETIKWRFYTPSKDAPSFNVYHYHLEKLNNIIDYVGGQSVMIYTEHHASGTKELVDDAKIHYTRQKTNDGWTIVVEIKFKWFDTTDHPGLYGIYFLGTEYDDKLDFTYNNQVVMRYGGDSFFDTGDLDLTIRHDFVLGEWNEIPINNIVPQPQGSPLHLKCYVLGYHVTKVSWIKDNQILNERKIADLGGSIEVKTVKGVDYVRSDLRFAKFKNSLSGSYTCRAETDRDVLKEETYEIQGYSRVQVYAGVSKWNENEATISCSISSQDKIASEMQFLTKTDLRTTEWRSIDVHSGVYNLTIMYELPRDVYGLLVIKKSYDDLKDESFRCQALGELDGIVQKGHDDVEMKENEDYFTGW